MTALASKGPPISSAMKEITGPVCVKLDAGESPGITFTLGGYITGVKSGSKTAASGVSAQGNWRLASTSDVPIGRGAGLQTVQGCLSSVREADASYHLVFVIDKTPLRPLPSIHEAAAATLAAQLDGILDAPPVPPLGMVYSRDVSEISDWLLLGSYTYAKQLWRGALPNSGIDCVISVIHDPYDPAERPSDEVLAAANVSVFSGCWSSDNDDYDILIDYFETARPVLSKARCAGQRSFVHCLQGFNRSAAICCAFLVEHEKMALTEAAALLHHRRGGVLGNRSFRRQLVHLALGCGPDVTLLSSVPTVGHSASAVHSPAAPLACGP